MKRTALLLTLFVAPGCRFLAPQQPLDVQIVGPLMIEVIEQHDESVLRDPVLVPVEKEQAIRGAAIVREAIEEAMGQ